MEDDPDVEGVVLSFQIGGCFGWVDETFRHNGPHTGSDRVPCLMK